MRSTTVGQNGLVTLDAETHKVLRLSFEATEIPVDFAIRKASTTVEYAFIPIAGNSYLLPVRANSEMLRGDPTKPMPQSSFETAKS